MHFLDLRKTSAKPPHLREDQSSQIRVSAEHGVLWAMPARKADPMGDIVLSTFMGHGCTIL